MNVIVIGAGVAGAATALALARQGHEVRVFERRTSSQSLGAGVVLWPNGTFVLSSLGLLEHVRLLGSTPVAMKRFDCQGSSLGSLELSRLEQLMGYPTVAILRADLQSALLRALSQRHVPVADGHEAVAIASGERSAQVTLASGAVASADLIIGADGRMASVARRYVRPMSSPVYQGVVNWIGVSTLDADLPDPRSILDYWGLGERFGIVPVGRRTVYWAGAAAAADPPSGPTRGDFRTALMTRFTTWPSLVTEVIGAAQAATMRRIPVYDLDPSPLWHQDRLLLVGDAAHAALPTSGQGACQALEDAWHLARCLGSEPRDLQNALASFTALRFEKTRSIVHAGRALSTALFTLDRRTRAERDEAARASDSKRTIAAMAAGWGAALPLPRTGVHP